MYLGKKPYVEVKAGVVLQNNPEESPEVFEWLCEKLEKDGKPVTAEDDEA